MSADLTKSAETASTNASVNEHLEVFTRGAVDVHVQAELTTRLDAYLAGKRGPLRVKAGFDPTRPDLHLGHCVLLQKMRQIQDLGHRIIFLVGDYTAMVGDPTGQNDARPRLTREQVLEAAETYQAQAFRILDKDKTEVRFNGEWLGALSTMDLIELMAKSTIARILERDDFSKRWKENRPIYGHEFLYPLLQGYDSVALEADLELGGTDQLFNLNVGRDLMPRYGKPAQCVITMPLLEGLDARLVDDKISGKKMSKSADNYIGISEPPAEMFRKAMLIDDAVIWRYYELLSSRSLEEIAALKAATTDPREPKRLFGVELVTRFWSAEDATRAEEEFRRVYTESSGLPDDIPEHTLTVDAGAAGMWIAKALAETKLVQSSSEGKRLVKDGGVEVDGVRLTDDRHTLAPGARYLLRAGAKKRRYAYVTIDKASS
jgi:tyrosyl-tRNA synthetase